ERSVEEDAETAEGEHHGLDQEVDAASSTDGDTEEMEEDS
ncbi:hypothetical protein A2U01_0108617, partial [Trifolium medium]|nr:hypothetical protein [Trifolium medium]